jgi:L,D-transpeptidase catalytic domain
MRRFHARLAVLSALVAAVSAGAATDAPARRIPIPEPARVAEPATLIAEVAPGSSVAVRSAPGGELVTRLGSSTEFGSRRALLVARRRANWLGVVAPELGNGRIGWIDARAHRLVYRSTPYRLEVDLSRRELRLHRGDRVVRRLAVSVGRPGSPTPIGRYAITDKLPGPRFSSVYGCCILALSGRQTRLPAGWTGGDRLAIHGSPGDAGIGSADSSGCLHARTRDLLLLMRVVPVGTSVVIHP